MRTLAVFIPEWGHINPVAPTLRELEARGDDVVVGAIGDVATLQARLGEHGVVGPVLPLGCPPPPPQLHRSGRALADTIRDARQLSAWIEALLLGGVDALADAVVAAIDEVQPDVVVVDPMLYGAVIAAMTRGVPWVALSSSLNPVTPPSWQVPLTATISHLSKRRRNAFARRGLAAPAFAVADALSPWLSIAFSVDAYAPRRAANADDVFALGAPFVLPPTTLAPRRGLYVSFGSQAFFQPALFRAAFAAADQLGLDVVASVGDLVDDEAFVASAPTGARLHRFAPQLDILQSVEVTISHGGANSVVEALSLATPLVLLPLCNDQHLQARFMGAADVGAVVDADQGHDALVRALVAAIDDVRSEQKRRKQRDIAAAIAVAGGPARAAQLIGQLARQRQPLRAGGT